MFASAFSRRFISLFTSSFPSSSHRSLTITRSPPPNPNPSFFPHLQNLLQSARNLSASAPKPKKKPTTASHRPNARFPKHRKGRMTKGTSSVAHPSFGKYALQALEHGRITERQIKAARQAMTRYARAGGKLWVRVFADRSVTARPPETRMGRGKGAVAYRASVVKPGRILYEMNGISEAAARTAVALAARKLPIRTQFAVSA